jgi:phosphopantothenoylcysteine synthetase/decarboxylase
MGNIIFRNRKAKEIDKVIVDGTEFEIQDYIKALLKDNRQKNNFAIEIATNGNHYNFIFCPITEESYFNIYATDITEKKQSEELTLVLHRTQDILKTLGAQKQSHQLLIGFALETENGKEHALKKLADKNADAIILNMWEEGKTGFGVDTNRVSIYEKNGKIHQFELKTKKELAEDIVNTVKTMLNA